ncbi:MAG: MarR family transcriptional regulator [Patescibacteria group bacterium]
MNSPKGSTRNISYNLHKVVFMLDKIADKALSDHLAMTFSQLKILMAIKNECVSQKDIAEYWDITEAAISRQVEILVGSGLISREENSKNRRQNILKMTKEGEIKLEEAFNVLDSHYDEIFKELDENEKKILVEGLHKLLKVLCTNKHTDPFITCTKL